jgi:hypothetical protein
MKAEKNTQYYFVWQSSTGFTLDNKNPFRSAHRKEPIKNYYYLKHSVYKFCKDQQHLSSSAPCDHQEMTEKGN